VAAAALVMLPRSRPRRRSEPHALLAASLSLLHNRQLLASLLATLGTCSGFGIFLSFLPLYAAGKGLDPVQVGLVFAAQALTNVVSRIPVGMVADRLDRRWIVAAGLVCFAAGLATMGFFDRAGMLMACAVLLGGGMALSFTAIGALVAEAVPPAQRGLAMGMFNSCIYLGMMAGSATLGLFIVAVGYPAGFAAGGAAALVALALFLLLMRGRMIPQRPA
jgi:MFS family permease